jgi:hypothetical protein
MRLTSIDLELRRVKHITLISSICHAYLVILITRIGFRYYCPIHSKALPSPLKTIIFIESPNEVYSCHSNRREIC